MYIFSQIFPVMRSVYIQLTTVNQKLSLKTLSLGKILTPGFSPMHPSEYDVCEYWKHLYREKKKEKVLA